MNRATADKNKILFVMLGLTIAVLAVFWQVHKFEFVNYDDDKYVSENGHILSGLNLENVIWVFTNEHCCNWHPLTGLSHILDCQFFGLNAGRHHLVNLLFHVANTLLLFTILRKMTAAFWQSAFVAAFFALHPLHVESVAWISERKDVLSTVFWLLTIAAYFRYAKNPTAGRYILALFLFVLGLLSKPMLVTLPFVLLLLDYWPLNRLEIKDKQRFYHLVREKIPFLVLSAISCVVTIIVQSKSGALKNIEQFHLSARVYNAVISYVGYIVKLFAPMDLAVFYPHPGNNLPSWQIIGAAVLLVLITFAVIKASGKYKYLLTGWFWYVGTLVPVIGLVQVGEQSMADRYTYVPFIGLFVIIAWGTNDLLAKWKYKKVLLSILSLTIVLILAVLTQSQTAYWHDSISLFSRAIDVTNGNYVAYNSRGNAYSKDKQRYDLAIADYNKALEIKPRYSEVFNNLGNAYKNKGEYDIAIINFNKALEIDPKFAEAYNNRGAVYFEKGEFDAAITDYDKAIELKPQYAEAYNNRGNALARGQGKFELAIADYNKALAINPKYSEAYSNRANTYKRLNRFDLAITDYNRAIELNPRNADTYGNRGNAYAQGQNRFDLAIADYNKAIEINPLLTDTYFNKALACESAGLKKEAIEAYEAFIRHASDPRQAQRVEYARQRINQLMQ